MINIKTIAEIGINHNGDLDLCKHMIFKAKESGVDYVKFQKRNPDICVPEEEKNKLRDTPWGKLTYLDYKHRIEFNEEYYEIDRYCQEIGIDWFVSVWDTDSVKFMVDNFSTTIVKIPSAKASDTGILSLCNKHYDKIIVSTGMCTLEEIQQIANYIDKNKLVLMHTVSTYPTKISDLHIDTIDTLKQYDVPVGYSGHELGTLISTAVVYKGISWLERHFTSDKTLWGTDQSCSLEPQELKELIANINLLLSSCGHRTGLLDCEIDVKKKLR